MWVCGLNTSGRAETSLPVSQRAGPASRSRSLGREPEDRWQCRLWEGHGREGINGGGRSNSTKYRHRLQRGGGFELRQSSPAAQPRLSGGGAPRDVPDGLRRPLPPSQTAAAAGQGFCGFYCALLTTGRRCGQCLSRSVNIAQRSIASQS